LKLQDELPSVWLSGNLNTSFKSEVDFSNWLCPVLWWWDTKGRNGGSVEIYVQLLKNQLKDDPSNKCTFWAWDVHLPAVEQSWVVEVRLDAVFGKLALLLQRSKSKAVVVFVFHQFPYDTKGKNNKFYF